MRSHCYAQTETDRRSWQEFWRQHPSFENIGDAFVGANANVRAGTITCNYDGTAKHRTEIGKDAFIGSNSALVAPVRIGDGAYIGSGSVITQNVPADALELGRSRQTVKEGWATRLRGLKTLGKKTAQSPD
jgi:bifunctional UDP-N-acetylglucosamine pyrophosphorylase / glucosamine-1-phosphate N-acetyltransferase